MKKTYLVKAYKKNIGWALFSLLGFIVCVFCFVDGNPAGGIVGVCMGIPSLVGYIVLTKKAIKEEEINEATEEINEAVDKIVLKMILKSCLASDETQEHSGSDSATLSQNTKEQ